MSAHAASLTYQRCGTIRVSELEIARAMRRLAESDRWMVEGVVPSGRCCMLSTPIEYGPCRPERRVPPRMGIASPLSDKPMRRLKNSWLPNCALGFCPPP